jgi:hypothetical protein
MAKVLDIDQDVLAQWLAERPQIIKDMVARLPPDHLYRFKPNGHRVLIVAYSEDDTLRVLVSGKYNLVVFDRAVFGVKSSDLEECELPSPDEPTGTLLGEMCGGIDELTTKGADRVHKKHPKTD